jgi:hypothetical protein
MMQRLILPVALAVALFGAIVYIVRLQGEVEALKKAGGQAPATATARSPAAPSSAGPARTVTDEQRQAMLEVLRSETGPVRKVWFQVEQNKPEHAAFEKALEQVFRDAGWDVTASGSGGMVFKPGVYLLVADDEWPAYAEKAYDAFQKAGIDVKAARGYRAYYEEQKRDKPGWTGPKLADDQTYVVLVGPSPAS